MGRRAAIFVILIPLIMLAGSPSASAENFRITAAAGHPTTLHPIGVFKDYFIPEVNRRVAAAGGKHTITWTQAWGGSLVKFDNVLEAVEDGIIDVGWVGTLFEEAKLPLHSVTYVTPFSCEDVVAVIQSMHALHEKLPVLRQQWDKYNQIYLGSTGVDNYHLYTNFPIKSLDDLKGKRLGTPGTVANLLQGTGAVAVSSPIPEFYNSIKTGVYQGAVTFFSAAGPNRLVEIAPYVTLVGIGAHYVGGFTINKKSFNRFPPEVQKLFMEVGQDYTKQAAKVQAEAAETFRVQMQKAGAKFSTLPAEEKTKWVKAMPNLAREWTERLEPQGLPAKAVLKAYMDELRARGAKPLRDWEK
jgi:TRAP-type C4-dicarboxylate transport system substrate-binding protein